MPTREIFERKLKYNEIAREKDIKCPRCYAQVYEIIELSVRGNYKHKGLVCVICKTYFSKITIDQYNNIISYEVN